MQDIATRIEALRVVRGISVARLATEAAIPRMTLTRRLIAPQTFTLDELDRVAAVLGTTTLALAAPEAS